MARKKMEEKKKKKKAPTSPGSRENPTTKKEEDEVSTPRESQAAKREITRSKIAFSYILGFITITAGVIIIGAVKGYSVGENKDMLLAISGVLSGPLGFIIGYYFKGGE